MAAKFGFKRLTIRVLDGSDPTPDENVFVIEGKQDKGATQTAKISGLSADPIKTYGSDIAYYTSRKGVGDVKVALGLLDVPAKVSDIILGHKTKNEIVLVGAETEAPYVSILIESTSKNNKPIAYGFFKGSFSQENDEFESKEEKQKGLPTEDYDFTALASDNEEYSGAYLGKVFEKEETITKLKQALGITAS